MLAHVVAHQLSVPLMIPQCHPPAAHAADNQALEQGWTLTGRTFSPVVSMCLSASPQRAKIFLVLLPTDISGMGIRDQRMPVFLPLLFIAIAPIGSLTGTGSSEDEGSSITGIAQDLDRPAMAQIPPDQLPFVGTSAQTSREAQTVAIEVSYCRQGRALPLINLKKGANCLLDLPVRVEDDFALHVIDQAYGQGYT